MATIVNYDGGLKRIEFSLTPRGPRKTLRLGGVNVKTAGTWKAMVETIIGDKLANRPHDAEVSKWLGGLDESMLKRMRAVGLADGVGVTSVSLSAFMDRYFAQLVHKPNTITFYKQVRSNLEEYFTPAKLLAQIRPEDADGWRAWMSGERGLGAATTGRRVVGARTMWRKAIRWKLVRENPFVGVKAGQYVDQSRKHFISRDVAQAVLDACPDSQWKLLFALSRYGGLRCPSEHLAMMWQDVDFEQRRIVVRSCKTEHHEGGATRTIPMFPELEALMVKAFNETPEGNPWVIWRYRQAGCNLRTQLERIIAKAKQEPWPKLFHNLRASRESELMREYDLATVCKWIGNSPAVAAKHYAVSVDLDDDFRRAAGIPEQAQQKAQQSAVSSPCQRMSKGIGSGVESPEIQGKVTDLHLLASVDQTLTDTLMGHVGLEPTTR